MSRHITHIIIIIIIIIIVVVVVIIVIVKCSQIRPPVLLQFKIECQNCATYSQYLVKCLRHGIN